jgi:Ran GTPase-activating protein (RanGAP) involved in mRNA processing and transport
LHVLKPNPKNTSTNIPIREVKFDPGARVSKCFDSAIKCWRIMKPLAIDVCDQDLEDDHIIQLSKLLKKDMPMFEQLTLRRNLIKDKGALALAEYIETNPSCFHYLEISRNSISDEGAQAFLKALKKNTRLTTLLFEYGNLITDTKLLREIE